MSTQNKKRIMVKAKLLEISAVDRPAQPDAKVVLRKRDEPFEKLKPNAGESREDFMARFMGDEKMKEEYPDTKQRTAVAMSMFGRSRTKKSLSEELTPAGSEDNQTPAGTEDMTQEQIVALQKRAERAEKALSLSTAERELFNKMDASKQDLFLSLSPEGRATEVAKAADSNPVVYTDSKGRQFRKNDDNRLVELAKDADEARQASIAAENRSRLERISKRASDLKHLPGKDTDRVLLVEAVEKMSTEQQVAINAMLDKMNTDFAKAFSSIGTSAGPSADADSPEAQLEALAKSIKDKEPTLTDAQAYAKAAKSTAGQELYRKMRG